MNTMEIPIEKVETLKEILQDISGINNDINMNLQMIADALACGSCPSNNAENTNESLSIMASIRLERDKAQENLELLIRIRNYLW